MRNRSFKCEKVQYTKVAGIAQWLMSNMNIGCNVVIIKTMLKSTAQSYLKILIWIYNHREEFSFHLERRESHYNEDNYTVQASRCYQEVEEEDGYFRIFFLLDVVDGNNKRDECLVVDLDVFWLKLYKRLKKKNRLNTRLDRTKKNLKNL